MLIRKNVYSFLTCIARSGNAILQSIMNRMHCILHHWVAIGGKCYMYVVIRHTFVFYIDVMFRNKVIELKICLLQHCIVLSSPATEVGKCSVNTAVLDTT